MLFIKKAALVIAVIITAAVISLMTACKGGDEIEVSDDKTSYDLQTDASKTTNISTESSSIAAATETTTNSDDTNLDGTNINAAETQEVSNNMEDIKAEFEILRSSEADPLKIFEFIDKNIKFADMEFADEMVDFAIQFSESELYPLLDKYADTQIQQKLWDDFNGTTDLQILKNADDKTIAYLAKETIDRKYKLEGIEGFISPILDYESYKAYGEFISEQMSSFIEIMASESESPSVMDGGIVITLDDYTDRIIKLYEFEEKYPGFLRIYYVVNMLNGKLWVYMGGIDNTPVFDFKDSVIIKERLENFELNAQKYKGTRFGDKLNEYLDLLKEQGYKRTQKIADYLNSLTFY